MKVNGKNYGDDQPVKLVYEPESRVIVKFPEGLKGRAEFAKDVSDITKAMKELGIHIPPYFSKEFPDLFKDEQVVFLNDLGFGKAFYEIYFCDHMNPEKFKWQLIS